VSYRSKVLKSQKVNLSEDYWAEIRPLTGGEWEACQETLLGGPITGYLNGQVSADKYTFNQREFTRSFLALAITRWNIDDDAGNVLPIDAASIDTLSASDRLTLVRAARLQIGRAHV